MLTFLDYALSLSPKDVRGVDLTIARMKVRVKSLLRRMVIKTSSRVGLSS
jgi:hypothetical protein